MEVLVTIVSTIIFSAYLCIFCGQSEGIDVEQIEQIHSGDRYSPVLQSKKIEEIIARINHLSLLVNAFIVQFDQHRHNLPHGDSTETTPPQDVDL